MPRYRPYPQRSMNDALVGWGASALGSDLRGAAGFLSVAAASGVPWPSYSTANQMPKPMAAQSTKDIRKVTRQPAPDIRESGNGPQPPPLSSPHVVIPVSPSAAQWLARTERSEGVMQAQPASLPNPGEGGRSWVEPGHVTPLGCLGESGHSGPRILSLPRRRLVRVRVGPPVPSYPVPWPAVTSLEWLEEPDEEPEPDLTPRQAPKLTELEAARAYGDLTRQRTVEWLMSEDGADIEGLLGELLHRPSWHARLPARTGPTRSSTGPGSPTRTDSASSVSAARCAGSA